MSIGALPFSLPCSSYSVPALLFQVQLALDQAQRLVVNAPSVTQADHRRPLGSKHLSPELLLVWLMPIEGLIASAIHRLGQGLQLVSIVGTQVGERVLGNPHLARLDELASASCACCHEMCLGVFALQRAVSFEIEQTDEGREAQSLPNEREQDDREGEEDDEITLGVCVGHRWAIAHLARIVRRGQSHIYTAVATRELGGRPQLQVVMPQQAKAQDKSMVLFDMHIVLHPRFFFPMIE